MKCFLCIRIYLLCFNFSSPNINKKNINKILFRNFLADDIISLKYISVYVLKNYKRKLEAKEYFNCQIWRCCFFSLNKL